MPTPFLKNLAEKHNLSLSTVEGYWDKAKEIASKEYSKSSEAYWPVVVKITEKFVNKKNKKSCIQKYLLSL